MILLAEEVEFALVTMNRHSTFPVLVQIVPVISPIRPR